MGDANDIRLTAEQEAELMAAFHAWFELWNAASAAHGLERADLDAQAANVFRAQTGRGGAYAKAWVLIQDTLTMWWELPEQMREWLRTTPINGGGFAARANRAVAALDTDGN